MLLLAYDLVGDDPAGFDELPVEPLLQRPGHEARHDVAPGGGEQNREERERQDDSAADMAQRSREDVGNARQAHEPS